MRASLALLYILLSSKVCAAYVVGQDVTAGGRFGMAFVHQMLASPPLPSPDVDQRSKLSLQASYGKGTIKGVSSDTGTQRTYDSDPEGYGVGVGFTSSSTGRFSYFLYALYTSARGQLNVRNPSAPDVSGLQPNAIHGSAGGMAVNALVVGDLKSAFNMGIFLGGQTVESHTNGKWGSVYATNASTGPPTIPLSTSVRAYGPISGLQVKLRMGAFSVVPYVLHFADISKHCGSLLYEGPSLIDDKCAFSINSSYTAAGVALGYGPTRLTVYSKVWNSVSGGDSEIVTYQAGFSVSF